MARPKRKTKIDNPFDVELTPEKRKAFEDFFFDELEAGLSARSELMDEYGLIDLWNALYAQASRNRKGPWPGAADLGSYIPPEKVDAMRAKIVKIVGKAEPLCVVEGRGATAENAPVVEEFHEWAQQREEKLFVPLVKWAHQALVERVGILETYERIEHEVTVEDREVLVEVDPNNLDPQSGLPAVVLDPESKQPMPIKGQDGGFIDAREGEPSAKTRVRNSRWVHKGPGHRVISGKHFGWLPAHACESAEVWCWFKRFYRTGVQLQRAVEEGMYDKAAVEALGKTHDRQQGATEDAQNISVQHSGHPDTAEHELFECQVYYDFEGVGPQWWILTVNRFDRLILRIKYDQLNLRRYTLGVLFLNPYAVDGYSLVGDKLYSVSEEHAALRNMRLDRTALKNNAPILKVIGTNWNPQRQPWSPRQVITVNNKGDIDQARVDDVPESVVLGERQALQAGERLSGAADIVSSGVQPDKGSVTATEIASSAGYSSARLEEQVALTQESVEHLYELRHRIWLRALEFNGGIEPDADVVERLRDRGQELPDGKITAQLLRGPWRFKPRGSVESADPILIQRRFAQRYADLFMLIKAFPLLQQWALASPELAEAALQDWADVHKPRNRSAFNRPLARQQALLPAAGPFGALPGAQPGRPPLLPPAAPAIAAAAAMPEGVM